MKRRNRIYIGAAIAILCIFIIVSLEFGHYSLSVYEVISGNASAMATNVFYQLRLPRTIVAIISGFILAFVGSILQTIFKNPLASPEIIGMASGASSGAAIAIVLFSGSFTITMISAFLGGILAVIMAIVLATQSKQKRLASFVLSGIVVNAIAQSLTMTMKLIADPEKQLASLEFWMMGGLHYANWTDAFMCLMTSLMAFFILWFLSWKLNLLSLGDEAGKSLGIHPSQLRLIIIFVATFAAAISVSLTGIIAWVGLMIPHAARLLLGSDHRWVVPGAAIMGAIYLLFCDTIARTLTGAEIPIGIVTSIVGAPYLLWLLRSKGRMLHGM